MSLALPERIIIYMEFPRECDDSYETEHYRICIDLERRQYLVQDKYFREADNQLFREIMEKMFVEGLLLEEIEGEYDERHLHVIRREMFGYSVFTPLLEDPRVINIHVHSGRKVQIVHQDYGRLYYPVVPTKDEVQNLIHRMTSKAGVPVSARLPLVSFVDVEINARISAIYPSDITLRDHAYVDIRKQPKEPWTIFKLMELGTVTSEEAAILWFAVKYKLPIMVIGEMFTGKTTLINALMGFLPPHSRIMTIEDTPELQVPDTSYRIRTITRDRPDMPEASITAFDLLKQAVRVSVDYVVVGEVRGEDARYWAQALLVGHGGLTSFHADSPEAAITRLTTPPISVSEQALKYLSIFVHIVPMHTGERLKRISYLYTNEPEGPVRVCTPEGCDIASKFLNSVHVDRTIKLYGLKSRARVYKEIDLMRRIIEEGYRHRRTLKFNDVPSYLYGKLEESISELLAEEGEET